MRKECLSTIACFCSNIEQVIRKNLNDCKDFYEQKNIMDLYLSVVNFGFYFEKIKDKK